MVVPGGCGGQQKLFGGVCCQVAAREGQGPQPTAMLRAWQTSRIRSGPRVVTCSVSIAPQSVVVATGKGIDVGRTVPEPDVLIVSRAVVRSGSLVFQPADVRLAIEVVSPGTTTKDRTLRPAQYAGAGIKCFWRVENQDDAMVVYTFELLPEGSYAPTGVFHSRVKLDRPFPIDIELPEVTW
ncbi:MAG TPA: Uma2 family endonuclease [Streptosporangiaceae bacterium]|nr:Uma2 family endonuclease [Streptosporangiaceae bacterium]